MHCPEKNCTSKYIASFTNIHKAVTDVFTFGNPDGTVRKYKRLYLCVSDLLTISTFCPCEGRPNPPEGLKLYSALAISFCSLLLQPWLMEELILANPGMARNVPLYG